MLFALFLAVLAQAPAGFRVSGHIVHSVTGQPVSRAKVYLAPVEQRDKALVSLTGPDGRFQFDGIAPGHYNLSADRNGFVKQSYGQRRLGQGYSTSIAVGDHDDTRDLVFRLVPGAAITGTITGANGDPVPGIKVFPVLITGKGTLRKGRVLLPGESDDRGYYRLFALGAGTYTVVVAGEPWQTEGLLGEAGEELSYPPTYFPGVTAPERAGTFPLQAGAEARADMALTAVPAGELQVRLIGADPADDRSISLHSLGPFGCDVWTRRPESVYEGSFRWAAVPFGHYVVKVWNGWQLVAQQGVDVRAASQEVTVGETPLADVSVVVQMATPEREPDRQVVLSLVDVNGDQQIPRAMERGRPTRFASVPPGRYTLTAGVRHQWPVLSAKARGASVRGSVVDIPETGHVELSVLLDPNGAEIEGMLRRGGRPWPGVIVVLAPKATWNDFTTYRLDQTNSDGSFNWYGVSAGDHFMFAFEEGLPMDYANPAVLNEHLREARPLRVTTEPKQSVTFQVDPPPTAAPPAGRRVP